MKHAGQGSHKSSITHAIAALWCAYLTVIVGTSRCVAVAGGGTPPGLKNQSTGETALGVALAMRGIAAAVESLASAVSDVVALIAF